MTIPVSSITLEEKFLEMLKAEMKDPHGKSCWFDEFNIMGCIYDRPRQWSDVVQFMVLPRSRLHRNKNGRLRAGSEVKNAEAIRDLLKDLCNRGLIRRDPLGGYLA